jgi:hypothetical protein
VGIEHAPDQVRKFPHVLNIQHVHAGVKDHVRRMRINPDLRTDDFSFSVPKYLNSARPHRCGAIDWWTEII